MRSTFSVLIAILVLSTPTRAAAPPRVGIAAVEIGASSFNGPGPIFRKGHPARFQVTLVNESAGPARGSLAAEVVGNLATVHALPELSLELGPKSRQAVTLAWDYPGTTVDHADDGRSHTVPSPRWGLTLNVAWRDPAGRTLDRGRLTFGIDRGGEEGRALTGLMASAGPRSDWTIRYSGYLSNPELRAIDPPTDFELRLPGVAVRRWKRGTGPDGADTVLAEIPDLADRRQAVLVHRTGTARLVAAWLLEPERSDGPRASRLRHLSDLNSYRFEIPPVPAVAHLVLVLGPSQLVEPVSLEELAARAEAKFGKYPDPLRSLTDGPVRTPAEWEGVRQRKEQTIRKALEIEDAEVPCDLAPRVVSEEFVRSRMTPTGWTGPYLRRKVSIQARPGERFNVWLLIPPGLGPFPAVLACHQTVSEGKDEPVGLGGNVWQLDFGPSLVTRGFVVAAVDSPTFGERYDPLGESPQDTSRYEAADPGWSLLARRFRDHSRTLDCLASLPQVARDRLGVIGHSLGGESAAVLAALDRRVRCAVISCPFTLLRTLEHARETYCPRGHAILPPRLGPLLDVPVGRRRLPFDFDDVMQLWAPRPVFYHEVRDELPQFTSAPQTLQAALALRSVYALLAAPGHYFPIVSAQAHCFPRWVQADAFDWLEFWLSEIPR